MTSYAPTGLAGWLSAIEPNMPGSSRLTWVGAATATASWRIALTHERSPRQTWTIVRSRVATSAVTS